MSVKPFFRWYDFWIGFYYSAADRTLYICPLPMVGLAISKHRECGICGVKGGHAPYCVYRYRAVSR